MGWQAEEMTAAYVGLDEVGPFRAEVAPVRWNGWACPFFTLDVVREIGAALDAARAVDPSWACRVEVTDDGRVVVTEGDGAEWYDPETIDPVTIGGVPMWCVGGWGWVWSERATRCTKCGRSDDWETKDAGRAVCPSCGSDMVPTAEGWTA